MLLRIKKAFTLSEVLITLIVIGVIAALTIPNLLQNIQDAQLKTAWRDAYSMLNQVSNRILNDNAGSIKNLCSDYDCYTGYLRNYLSYAKFCANSATGGCWHAANNWYYLNKNPAAILDNGSESGRNVGVDGIALNNGTLIFSIWVDSECKWTQFPNACGHITVDVNGFKGPNTVGKDIYAVYVTDDGIKPVGVEGTFYAVHRSCIGSANGYGCSAYYLMQ